MTARMLATCVLAVAAGAAATLAATSAGAADEQRHTVVLDNAFGLTEGSDLRSAGVVIGKVRKLSVQRSTSRALATIVVTKPSFAGFHADVFCEVKPQSLIGEYYLDCDPGKQTGTSAPATIPVGQTAGTIPPDLVLDILRRPARERFGLILTELGIGFTARGDDVQASLRRAVPALRETDRVLRILADNRRTLAQLTHDADRVLHGLAGNRADVARFVREAGVATSTSASRSRELRATVAKLPAFLRELRPTLADLGTTARVQTPALRDLRAAAPDLTELLQRLGPFADSARPAVRGLGEAAETGISAVREARSTVRRLRELGSTSTEPMRNLRFLLEDVDDRGRATEPNRLSPTGAGFTGLEAFLQYLFVQSQAINVFDSKSYMLKITVLLNECSQFTNAQSAIADPERTRRCRQWLGPNQPGITAGAVARTPRHTPPTKRAKRAPKAATPPASSTGTPPPPPPPAAAPPSVGSALDNAKKALDDLVQNLTDHIPPLLPRQSTRSERDADGDLLDYLLGP